MHKKIKTTITLSPHIKEFASTEARELGLDFSAYISILIAEKLRNSNIVASPTNRVSNPEPSMEATITTVESTIDNTQYNELDRLLNLPGVDE